MQRLPYPRLSPKPYQHMMALGHSLRTESALETVLLHLIDLRASIVNGCHFCIGMHTEELRKENEPQSRIDAVADWQNSDAFTLRERAAFAWTDAITNIQGTHACDADYAAVNQFFTGKDLVDLTWNIARINAWNRMGIAFAAEWDPPQKESKKAEPAPTIDVVSDDGGKVAED